MDKKRKTKKKLKLSRPETTSHSSNCNFICDKEVVIQLERLNESIIAEMTAGGSALPPEQTKKKLKLSLPEKTSHPSNPHFICDKEVVIQLERLSDSFVAEMTAGGSALPPEQVNESNDDALHINSLPNEIILKVFAYLEQNQLGQIARVCRRWNALTTSPVLWRKVNVKIFSADWEKNAVAKSFINRLPSCVTFIRLDFENYKNYISNFEELCAKLHQNCPHVEELILARCGISNIFPEVINFCTKFLQGLKKLVFHYCHFSKSSRPVEVDDNSKIEVLDLYVCKLWHFNKIQFSKLPYLKELHLAFTDVNDTWFVDDSSFLKQLHVLKLVSKCITSSIFLAIQNHGHNLKELYLCDCDLGRIYHNVNFNNSIFPHLNTICLAELCEEVDLSYSRVTCEVAVYFIQSCPSLENVYVDERVAESFPAHPFALANRCKSGIVKALDTYHNHDVDYSNNLLDVIIMGYL